MLDNNPASLLFMPDGRLAGNASCNRLIASYEVDGNALAISDSGANMMMCPEVQMIQERRLLNLLPMVHRYSVDDSGLLVLKTPDGDTITARRK